MRTDTELLDFLEEYKGSWPGFEVVIDNEGAARLENSVAPCSIRQAIDDAMARDPQARRQSMIEFLNKEIEHTAKLRDKLLAEKEEQGP